MTDQEWYDYGHAHCGIGVGDKVKVLRKAGSHEKGWGTEWCYNMDRYVGQILTVYRIKESVGFQFESMGFQFPFFVLGLIQKAESESPLPQSIEDIIDNEGCFSWTLKEPIKKLVAEILKQK